MMVDEDKEMVVTMHHTRREPLGKFLPPVLRKQCRMLAASHDSKNSGKHRVYHVRKRLALKFCLRNLRIHKLQSARGHVRSPLSKKSKNSQCERKLMSEWDLEECKLQARIQSNISEKSNRFVLSCSDGAFLEGAKIHRRPKHTRNVELASKVLSNNLPDGLPTDP